MIRYQPYRVSKLNGTTNEMFSRTEQIIKRLNTSMNKIIRQTNIYPFSNYKTLSSSDLFIIPSIKNKSKIIRKPKKPLINYNEIDNSDVWKYFRIVSTNYFPSDRIHKPKKKKRFVRNPLEIIEEKKPDYKSYHLYGYKRSKLFQKIYKEYKNSNSQYTVFPIKILQPGHISLCLYYPHKGLLEYFDSYGSKYKSPKWRNDEPINPRYQWLSAKYALDRCILYLLNQLKPYFQSFGLPLYNVVAINCSCDLQKKTTKLFTEVDADVYCQTWIYYYVYCKYTNNWTTKQTIENFQHTKPKVRLQKIEQFWRYLMEMV